MPLPPPAINLAPESLEEVWHELNLVDHDKPPGLFVEVKIGLLPER